MDIRREMKPEGHQMLSIANESRLLDTVENGEWTSRYVGARNSLPKGLYDVTGAERPGKNAATKTFEGTVLHVDSKHVYQLQTEAKGKPHLVRHDRNLYKEPPPVGATTKVEYLRGVGQVANREHSIER